MKHCLKQVVKALIYQRGEKLLLVAYNDIENESVSECPRQGMLSGEGYELCKSICNQQGHAEIQAVDKAIELGIDLSDCYLVIEGHSYICNECQSYMRKHGLTYWMVRNV